MIKTGLFFCVLYISLFAQTYPSQSSEISSELQKKLASKNMQSENDVDFLNLEKMVNKNKDRLFSPSDSDSTRIDSVSMFPDSQKISDSTLEKLSTYQKIIRGDTINPDSMLKNLPLFGYDFFSRAKASTFAPTNNFSIPSEYVINTDDEIIIFIWGRINEEHRLKVTRDGTINIPRIGPVSVSGLQFNVMQKNILSRIEQIEGAKATISVGTLRTIGIFIVGEVNSPGFYSVSALSNVTNALFAAGGITNNGSLRNVQLKRNGKTVASIDIYDFLLNGEDKTGLRLEAGDVIHVPIVEKMVAIAGNVRKPALYEISGTETLQDIVSLAGGFSPAAYTNKIQIARFTENNRQDIFDIDSSGSDLSKVAINDGDIIKVFPILFKDQNAIYLEGNVLRPGRYEFKSGMKISDIVTNYKELLPETYYEYALIIRQDPPQYQNRMLTFNLKDILDNQLSEKNIPLQERDKIIIYNRDYFEPNRIVEIAGSVTAPGKIKLLHSMTIRDVILQAGGLSEDASSTRGELYRRTVQKSDLIVTNKIDFCVECAMQNDPQNNIIVNRSDRIFIRSKLGWEKESKVTLSGQFKYPGIYVVFEGETLGELIERAGGFTANAYLAAAVFTRISVKEKEKAFLEEYNKQFEKEIMNLSSEFAFKEDAAEAIGLLEQQKSMQKDLSSGYKFGRVVINLNDKNNFSSFTLEHGDELFVPRNLNTISVLGEVFNPSTFKYDNIGNTVSYYIEAAGGMKSTSDKKHIYIIKANGSIITNNKIKILTAQLEPGDAVVVPQKIKYANPQKIFVDTVDAIFKISTVLGTVLALIIQLNR